MKLHNDIMNATFFIIICSMTHSPEHKYALYGLKAKWEDEPSDQRVAFPRQLEPTLETQGGWWAV